VIAHDPLSVKKYRERTIVMKKALLILLASLFSFMLFACETTDPNTQGHQTHSHQEEPSWYACNIPPQPVRVETISDAEKMLLVEEYYKTAIMARQPNRIAFSAEEEQAYEHMINTFHSVGFLPLATCYEKHDGWVIFFPETRGEDVGVKSRCACGDSHYDYIVYIPKQGYPTSSITEYWDARMGTEYRKNVSICTVDDESQSTEVIYRPFIKDQQKITFMKDGFVITIICDKSHDISNCIKNFEIEQIPISEKE